jgi:cell division protein FtsB
MLSKKPMGFSEMLEVLRVSSSFLTYHLENLGELIGKTDDGKYRLSSFGDAAMSTMTKVEDIPATASQQPLEKGPKRIVRSVSAALGLICIVLIALIAYSTVIAVSTQNNYNNLQNQNRQLQTWLDENETLLNQTKANYANVQNQNANLASQVSNLTGTLNLQKSVIWVKNQTVSQQADSYADFYYQVNNVAGYVSVNITSSTTDNTYVEVTYSGHIAFTGIHYDNTITVGKGGIADFPFVIEPVLVFPYLTPLPTIIEIRVGNTNAVGNATETVTITYYY